MGAEDGASIRSIRLIRCYMQLGKAVFAPELLQIEMVHPGAHVKMLHPEAHLRRKRSGVH